MRFVYVAKRAAPGVGTPSPANTGLHDTLAAAKLAPLPTIGAALALAGPGVAIVIGDGTYDEQVNLRQEHSGAPGRPLLIVSETRHGAHVRGPRSGARELSAVWAVGCRHFELHNLFAEVTAGNSGDHAAFKIFRLRGEPIAEGGVVVAGCKGRGRGNDILKVSGLLGTRIYGCDLSSEGGSFTQSCIDCNTGQHCEIKFNTLRGRVQNGLAVKNGAYDILIEQNDIDVRQKVPLVSYTPGLFLGHDGVSEAGSPFPFRDLPWFWAECAGSVVRNNMIGTDWTRALWAVGAYDCLIERNVLKNRGNGAIISMRESKSGIYAGMPEPSPEHAPYVHIDPDGLGHYDTRFLTIRDNAVLAGSSVAFEQQHRETNKVERLSVVSSAAEHIPVPIGVAAWDHGAIYRRLGSSGP